jgi:hypothetical protein
MNEKNFSKEWDSLSSEQQEAFRAWVKAKLNADKAQEKFINMYLRKEFRQLPAQEVQRDLLIEFDREYFETLVKKIFIDVLVLLTNKCDYCRQKPPEEQFPCFKACMKQNLAQVEVDIN